MKPAERSFSPSLIYAQGCLVVFLFKANERVS